MKKSQRNTQTGIIIFFQALLPPPKHVVIVFAELLPSNQIPPSHKAPTVFVLMLSGGGGDAGWVHAVRQHLSSGGPGLWDETRLFLLPQHSTALRPSQGGLKMQHLLCLFIFHGEALPCQLQPWLIHSPPGASVNPFTKASTAANIC